MKICRHLLSILQNPKNPPGAPFMLVTKSWNRHRDRVTDASGPWRCLGCRTRQLNHIPHPMLLPHHEVFALHVACPSPRPPCPISSSP